MADLQFDRVRIGEFCEKWKVAEFAIFGSALRAELETDSDVDVLVTFRPDSKPSLFDLAKWRKSWKGCLAARLTSLPGRELRPAATAFAARPSWIQQRFSMPRDAGYLIKAIERLVPPPES